jgi:hypothetical protein
MNITRSKTAMNAIRAHAGCLVRSDESPINPNSPENPTPRLSPWIRFRLRRNSQARPRNRQQPQAYLRRETTAIEKAGKSENLQTEAP